MSASRRIRQELCSRPHARAGRRRRPALWASVVLALGLAAALPAHATMFSGLPPGEHGLTTQARAFSPLTPLFPEMLKERGYRNGAVVSSLLLSPTFGYAPGFDKYEMNIEFSGEEVVQKGLRWLFSSKKTPLS